MYTSVTHHPSEIFANQRSVSWLHSHPQKQPPGHICRSALRLFNAEQQTRRKVKSHQKKKRKEFKIHILLTKHLGHLLHIWRDLNKHKLKFQTLTSHLRNVSWSPPSVWSWLVLKALVAVTQLRFLDSLPLNYRLSDSKRRREKLSKGRGRWVASLEVNAACQSCQREMNVIYSVRDVSHTSRVSFHMNHFVT